MQINLAKLANTADDSAGGITDTQVYVDELLEKVCGAVEYESPDARYIFLQSAKDSTNKAFDGWTEFAYNILKKTARLAEEDTEQKMYTALDELYGKSADSYSRWYLEHDVLVRLEIIKVTHGEIDAEAFIKANTEYNGIRKIAIQNAIEKGDFDLAEKLCLEKVTNETARHEWSRPCEWRYLLFEIYNKEGNIHKKSMKILVDADACPVKEIIVRLAKQRNIPVTMLIDTSHQLNDGYSTVITVDKQADSVDFALMGLLARDDVVVTQDYGLAAMALGKGAKVIHQSGMIYTNDNIDKLLMERHIGAKVRRGGGRTKGPAKRTKVDNERFESAFAKLLEVANAKSQIPTG